MAGRCGPPTLWTTWGDDANDNDNLDPSEVLGYMTTLRSHANDLEWFQDHYDRVVTQMYYRASIGVYHDCEIRDVCSYGLSGYITGCTTGYTGMSGTDGYCVSWQDGQCDERIIEDGIPTISGLSGCSGLSGWTINDVYVEPLHAYVLRHMQSFKQHLNWPNPPIPDEC